MNKQQLITKKFNSKDSNPITNTTDAIIDWVQEKMNEGADMLKSDNSWDKDHDFQS